ncbi:DUF805 domain-containing protein [Hymenobacter sp. B1770]|uniref:DUF805 domain-containing protein n=1 Tax=Hymenobacter sp. B1770 TaxID=1718788 RepID=UPI003CF23856
MRRRHFFRVVPLLYVLGFGFYALPSLLPATVLGSITELVATLGLMGISYLVVVQMLRRLHDLGLSAWWLLVILFPLGNYVMGAGLQFVQGTIGPNRFGPDPKRPTLLLSADIASSQAPE